MSVRQRNSRCLFIFTGAYHTDGGIAAVARLTIQAVIEAGYVGDILILTEYENALDKRYVNHIPTHVNYQVFRNNKYAFTLAVWKALFSKHYDLIFADHVNLAAILALIKLTKRCKYIVWLCGVEVFPPKPDFEGRLGLKYAWKRLAISEYTRDSVVSRFPRLPVTVCDLALDPIRHSLAFPENPDLNSNIVWLKNISGEKQILGEQVILHVGRMASREGYKGQDSLLQAFPLIQRQFPEAQLVLAGRGDDMPRLMTIAQALPLSVRVRVFMPGYVLDELLDQIYRRCYLFAMPSTGEGFGLVYLEAMSHGKPCLGGRVDATPWVVRDGNTGLLVDDPRSPEQIAEKILWLLSHPLEARQMGQAGFKLVQSYYLYPHFKERFWKAVLD